MKKDIEFPEVEKVGVCAVPDVVEGMEVWKVHLINNLDQEIENVLVSSRGYGKKDNEEVKTSELRHFFGNVDAQSDRAIELIPKDLTGLSNQYWVSFYLNGQIFDKKFIFLPDTLLESNMIQLPVVNQRGILII